MDTLVAADRQTSTHKLARTYNTWAAQGRSNPTKQHTTWFNKLAWQVTPPSNTQNEVCRLCWATVRHTSAQMHTYRSTPGYVMGETLHDAMQSAGHNAEEEGCVDLSTTYMQAETRLCVQNTRQCMPRHTPQSVPEYAPQYAVHTAANTVVHTAVHDAVRNTVQAAVHTAVHTTQQHRTQYGLHAIVVTSRPAI